MNLSTAPDRCSGCRRQLENPLATQLLEERFSGVTGVRVRAGDNSEAPFVFEPA